MKKFDEIFKRHIAAGAGDYSNIRYFQYSRDIRKAIRRAFWDKELQIINVEKDKYSIDCLRLECRFKNSKYNKLIYLIINPSVLMEIKTIPDEIKLLMQIKTL